MTCATLERRVWARHDYPVPNGVRISVKWNLRRKVGDKAANLAHILNERGVGYLMPEPGALRAYPLPAAGGPRQYDDRAGEWYVQADRDLLVVFEQRKVEFESREPELADSAQRLSLSIRSCSARDRHVVLGKPLRRIIVLFCA